MSYLTLSPAVLLQQNLTHSPSCPVASRTWHQCCGSASFCASEFRCWCRSISGSGLASKWWRSSCVHVSFFFVYFFGGLQCVGHSFAYVAHLWFLRDVWIRTQSTAVASWRATDLATHPSTPCFIHVGKSEFFFLQATALTGHNVLSFSPVSNLAHTHHGTTASSRTWHTPQLSCSKSYQVSCQRSSPPKK